MKLPIGKSDFKAIRDEGLFFVDKSLLIKEIIDTHSNTVYISRPRLYGKTMNLSMLRYFFEKRTTTDGSEGASLDRLFSDLAIWKEVEEYTNKQGEYPTIWLSFKDTGYSSVSDVLRKISKILQYEFNRHAYLLNDNLSVQEKRQFELNLSGNADEHGLEASISLLSELMFRHFNKKVMVFIDDIDVPVFAGYVNGYYERILNFSHNFLRNSFKDNQYIEKAVLSGTLNVFKESSFTGFTDFMVFPVTHDNFHNAYGFSEVELQILQNALTSVIPLKRIKDWYGGTYFGTKEVHNVWSVLNFIASGNSQPEPFWTTDVSDAILKELVIHSPISIKRGLFDLLGNKEIICPLNHELALPQLGKNDEVIWSYLVNFGYLTAVYHEYKNDKHYYRLRMPNIENLSLFRRTIMNWLDETVGRSRLEYTMKAILHSTAEEQVHIHGHTTTGPQNLDSVEQLFYEFINAISTNYKFKDSETDNPVWVLFIAIQLMLQDNYYIYRPKHSEYGISAVYVVPKAKLADDSEEHGNPEKTDDNNHKTNEDAHCDHPAKGYLIACRRPVYRNETIATSAKFAHDRIVSSEYMHELTRQGITNISHIAVGVSRYRVEVFGAQYGKGLLHELFHKGSGGKVGEGKAHSKGKH